MAVRVISRPRVHAPIQHVGVPKAVLGLALVAPALDLLLVVQPSPEITVAALVASTLGGAALLVAWLRFPRTSWLFAAVLAAVASLSMRLVGADVAPFLGLLSIVALGVGGAFAARDLSLEVA